MLGLEELRKKISLKKVPKDKLLFVPNLKSIEDEGEECNVPSIWYVHFAQEDTTIKVCISDLDIRVYDGWNYSGIETADSLIDGHHVEIYDEFDNNIPVDSVDREKLTKILDEIIALAEDYICDDPEYANMTLVSKGYPATIWDSHGDPGEPGEGPEWDIKCPHCGAPAPTDEEGRYRCDDCKKWMYISYT